MTLFSTRPSTMKLVLTKLGIQFKQVGNSFELNSLDVEEYAYELNKECFLSKSSRI